MTTTLSHLYKKKIQYRVFCLNLFLFLHLVLKCSAQNGWLCTGLFSKGMASAQHINWPTVYPERFKLSASPFYMSGSSDSAVSSTGYGLSLGGELLFYQVLSAGAGYEWAYIPKGDGSQAAQMHRLHLLSSLIIQLDKPERHHLLVLLRPGLGLVSAPSGSFFSAGFGFGFAYEYTLNADYTLMPEFLWQRYSGQTEKGLGVRGWSFGLRLSFGR